MSCIKSNSNGHTVALCWRGSRFHQESMVGICLIIVYVWSQYDGGNIEQRTIGYGSSQNQKANLKILGGLIQWGSE